MTAACVRCAVGAGVLSAALLIGGAPVAFADPDSDGGSTTSTGQSTDSSPAAGSDSTDGSDAAGPGTATRPKFDLRTSIRNSLREVRGVRGTVKARTAQTGADLAAELVPPRGAESPDAIVAEPGDAGTAPGGSTKPSDSGSATPVSQPTAPTPKQSPKAPLSYDKLPEVAATVGNTVAAVLNSTQQSVSAVPALLLGLPTSTTPVTDVISTLEFVLTSVNSSMSTIAALPGELSALMDVTAAPGPVAGSVPETRTAVPLAAADLPALMVPQPLTEAPLWSAPSLTTAEAPTLPAVTAPMSHRTAPLPEAPLGVSGLTASGAPESFLDRAVSTLLVPVSIAALAAVALPGVGGLLIICALGIRIGYRQAKAGWAVHVAGIGRFAGSGPLGVVRSGSMVALHVSRGTRAEKKKPALRVIDGSLERAA